MRNKDERLVKLSLNTSIGNPNISEFQNPLEYILELGKKVDLEMLEFLRFMEYKKNKERLSMYLTSTGEIELDSPIGGLESYVLNCNPSEDSGKFELSGIGYFSIPREIYLTDDYRIQMKHNGVLPKSFLLLPQLSVPKFDESLLDRALINSDNFNLFRD